MLPGRRHIELGRFRGVRFLSGHHEYRNKRFVVRRGSAYVQIDRHTVKKRVAWRTVVFRHVVADKLEFRHGFLLAFRKQTVYSINHAPLHGCNVEHLVAVFGEWVKSAAAVPAAMAVAASTPPTASAGNFLSFPSASSAHTASNVFCLSHFIIASLLLNWRLCGSTRLIWPLR